MILRGRILGIFLLVFGIGFILFTHPQNMAFSGATMGTSYSLQIYNESPFERIKARLTKEHQQHQNQKIEFEVHIVQAKIQSLLNSIESEMSTYDQNSDLSQLNQKIESRSDVSEFCFPVSQSIFDLMKTSQQVYQLSNGAYDVSIGPLVNLWGFGSSGQRITPPSHEEIHNTLKQSPTQFVYLETFLRFFFLLFIINFFFFFFRKSGKSIGWFN